MKKTAVFAVLVLCIAAVMSAGCITPDDPAEPLDYATALIGDWKSQGTYLAGGDVEYHIVYHFNADNTGKLAADVNGKEISSLDVFWGYVEKNGYIVAYTTSSTADYLYISEDGKQLINEFGEVFDRL